jgi:hypothetical protein
VTSSTALPIDGASTGARPFTSMSEEKKRAAAVPECRSRTTARDATTAAPAAKPCTKRRPASVSASGASAHSAEATV